MEGITEELCSSIRNSLYDDKAIKLRLMSANKYYHDLFLGGFHVHVVFDVPPPVF